MKKFLLISLIIVLSIMVGCSQQKAEDLPNDQSEATKQEVTDDFPQKPITWIIPYAAGGANDVDARRIAEAAKKYLPNNQYFIIENKPGGSGTIGMSYLVNAEPDGYTIATGSHTNLTRMIHQMDPPPYTLEDLQPVMQIEAVARVFVVHKDSPWKTFDEWLAYVKENPGEFRMGMLAEVMGESMELLFTQEDIELIRAIYSGEAETKVALAGKHIDGGTFNISGIADYIRSGEFLPLFYESNIKREEFKDIPTLTELGYEHQMYHHNGVVAPAGISKERLEIIHNALRQAVQDPEIAAQLNERGANINYNGPDEYQKILEEAFEFSKAIFEQVQNK